MTEENYNYRTSQTLLRNQFPGKGKLQIPIIPKFQEQPGDFDNLLLIGFDKTHISLAKAAAVLMAQSGNRTQTSQMIGNL